MARGRTVIGAMALVTGTMLVLAGNEIARAGTASSPFPPVAAAPPAAVSDVGPADPLLAAPAVAAGSGAADGWSTRTAPVTEGAVATGQAAGSDSAAVTRRDDPDPPQPADPEPAGPEPGDPSAGDPSTPAPAARTSQRTSAAERYGWGTPLPGSDEFDYTGPPDPAKWNVAGECWAGHAGNGKRCASRSTVDGSKLVQTGLANGDSAWLGSKTDLRHGRWEARVRSTGTGPANGRQYHPLLIIWPSSNRWPQDGEYDFLENGAPGQDCAESFIHYPHDAGVAVQQVFTKEKDCGEPLTEWHDVAFEWTPDHVRGYIDGKQWFDLSGGAGGNRRAIQDMPSGHLTIQLDNFFGANMQPATYEVDWVRIYKAP